MFPHIDMQMVTYKHRENVKEAIEHFKARPSAERFGYLMQHLAISYRVLKLTNTHTISHL